MTTTPTRRSTRIGLTFGALALATAASVGGIAAVSPPRAAAAPPVTATASPTSPAAPAASAASAAAKHARLIDTWLQLWNGDYRHAGRIISPDVRVHAPLLDGGDGSAIKGPQGFVAWISQTRAALPDLEFSIEVGPIVKGDHFALRWTAKGTYAGGIPGAGAPAGTPVSFTGIDLVRVQDGQVAEYWLNADTLGLLTQLQVKAG